MVSEISASGGLGHPSGHLAAGEWRENSAAGGLQLQRNACIPGQFAFFALPFEKQGKGGIWSGVHSMPVVRA